jgi:hypothetical protein
MIVSCCKTGRWRRVRDEAEARSTARRLGWVDYEITGEE